jgi:glycosyltransferase involved in cell wall biosynthesis
MPESLKLVGVMTTSTQVTLQIVIPVYNEDATLAPNVATLCAYLENAIPYRWWITIVDNASTDRTVAVARRLVVDPRIHVQHLAQKGRRRALKTAWLASEAQIVAYMDVDLSTNLSALLPLITPLIAGDAEIGIGSRLMRGATVTRQWKREVLSRWYNKVIRFLFKNRFSDAQCGFKALTLTAAQALLPAVEDDAWFFDTELLLIAEARGYRIHEVPVEWIEDLDSRVDLVQTVLGDLKGLWRMRTRKLS